MSSIKSLKENDSLKVVAHTSLNLKDGIQVISSPGVTPYHVTSLSGRTLVNILGRAGNCESLTPFLSGSGNMFLDSTTKVYGTNSIKLTAGSSSGYGSAIKLLPAFDKSKYYIALADLKNGTGTRVKIRLGNAGNFIDSDITVSDTTKFNTVWARYSAFQHATNSTVFEALVQGTVDQTGYIDGLRMYEITSAEYTALASMTLADIVAKYPYVDDMKAIVNPYIIKSGENLLPPFSEWTVHPNSTINAPYSLTHVATTTVSEPSYFYISVIPGQTYTLSKTGNAGFIIAPLESFANQALVGNRFIIKANDVNSITLTIPSGASVLAVYETNVASYTDITNPATYVYSTGTFSLTNVMLNLGSTALPFKQKNNDYLFFPNLKLCSSPTGTVQDSLLRRDGRYWKQANFKSIELDGSYPWANDGGVVQSGLKHVYFRDANYLTNAYDYVGTCSKYDGTISVTAGSTSDPVVKDRYLMYVNGVHIAVPREDSGWGDSYTPITAEIQAYFNGWVMVLQDTWNTQLQPYNGTGAKGWVRRYNGIGTPSVLPTSVGIIVNGSGQTNVPTIGNADFGWTNYKLQYQNIGTTLEEVATEGDISLHEGANQIEVGTGVIVRERANPMRVDGNVNYFINLNHASYPGNMLKNRTLKGIAVYKNEKTDNQWNVEFGSASYGLLDFWMPSGNYDPTAAYTVTYIADQYSLTSNVLSIQGQYPSNLKTAIDTYAVGQADLITRVGALEIVKKQKSLAQWVYPTLLNGWTQYGDGNPPNFAWFSYTKDDAGWVHFRGLCVPGTVADTTIICVLPPTYRPKNYQTFTVTCNGTSTGMETVARVIIYPDGTIMFKNLNTAPVVVRSGGWLTMSGIKYKVD